MTMHKPEKTQREVFVVEIAARVALELQNKEAFEIVKKAINEYATRLTCAYCPWIKDAEIDNITELKNHVEKECLNHPLRIHERRNEMLTNSITRFIRANYIDPRDKDATEALEKLLKLLKSPLTTFDTDISLAS